MCGDNILLIEIYTALSDLIGRSFDMCNVSLGLALVFQQNNPEENFHSVHVVKQSSPLFAYFPLSFTYSFNCGENWHDPVKCKVSMSKIFSKCMTLHIID